MLKELQNFLDSFSTKLLTDVVEVVRLVLPECKFNQRIRMLTIFKCSFRILLEYVLDLLGPMSNCLFKKTTFILA